MSETQLVELQKQHYSGHIKYVYFLLAVAASAIALSVQKTTGLPLSLSMAPLGIAVLLWGASFFFGCKQIEQVQSAMQSNYILLELHDERRPDQPETEEDFGVAEKETRKAIESKIKKAEFYGVWQFRLLVVGAISFLVWHVIEMALLTCKL